jgi:hypothetical protein
VCGAQRGGRDGDVAQPHLGDLLHHEVDDVVAVAKMVVKRNGHAVLEPAFLNGFANARDTIALLRHDGGARTCGPDLGVIGNLTG